MQPKFLLICILTLAVFLRLYHLSLVPPSLYWDEASLGYNAYSISQTLRDEHGEFLPISRFIAFGDYKPPLYIYATALSVKTLGLSEFSVRLPSAISGGLLVLLTYYLVQELLSLSKKRSDLIPLVAAFAVAISPWALQFSRAAFEANLATLLSASGILFFLVALRRQSGGFFAASAATFGLSLYTFNSHRVFVPLIIAALCLIFARDILAQKKKFLLFPLILTLLLLPLIPHLLSREGRLRFYEVTWLNDTAPIELSNERIAQDNNAWWANIIHNRRVVFGLEFLKHYTDHLRGDFLFFSGDVNPRLSIQTTGEMYWADLPLLLLGAFFLLKNRSKTSAVLFAWIFLAPVPAATARETPHALRILQILPALQIVTALGLWHLAKTVRSSSAAKILPPVLAVIFALSVGFYLHDYYVHYPKVFALDWQYGYKQMVAYVEKNQAKYDHINITEVYGRPYIYLLFYQKYPPPKYWASRIVDRDWYGFWSVHGFDKYSFGNKEGTGKWLFVSGPKDFVPASRLLTTISGPNGNVIFKISEK